MGADAAPSPDLFASASLEDGAYGGLDDMLGEAIHEEEWDAADAAFGQKLEEALADAPSPPAFPRAEASSSTAAHHPGDCSAKKVTWKEANHGEMSGGKERPSTLDVAAKLARLQEIRCLVRCCSADFGILFGGFD